MTVSSKHDMMETMTMMMVMMQVPSVGHCWSTVDRWPGARGWGACGVPTSGRWG
jgi:hypothetical protein